MFVALYKSSIHYLKLLLITKQLFEANIIQNIIFMVRSTYVRGSTLARLATASVLLSTGNNPALCQAGGKPSTGFPPETRRAEPII